MKKLRNNRGETLVEVMASIVIAALSVALLFSCAMASSNMDRNARDVDGKYYQALSAAEGRDGTALSSGKVEIKNTDSDVQSDITISIHGGEGLYSYRED